MTDNPLIDAQYLQEWLDNPVIDSPLLLDCRFSLSEPGAGEQDYLREHLPHALYAHLDRDLSAPPIPGQTGRHPLPDPQDLQNRLRGWGINEDTPVVAYDRNNAMFAARAWWLLRWAGVQRVQVLNGGMDTWQGPTQSGANDSPRLTGTLTVSCPADWVVSGEQVHTNLAELTLLDARALPRFNGEQEPLDARAGHIPGAWCADFTGNLDATGHFLSPQALAGRFAAVSSSPHLVSYCGSGVTACHTILAMTLAGYRQPRLYAGSWSEWITDPLRPIETHSTREPL